MNILAAMTEATGMIDEVSEFFTDKAIPLAILVTGFFIAIRFAKRAAK